MTAEDVAFTIERIRGGTTPTEHLGSMLGWFKPVETPYKSRVVL